MILPPPEVCQQVFAAWVLLGAPDWTEADRLRLFGLLAQHGLTINDLPQIFLAVNVTVAPSRPKDKIYERLWRLFGQLGSDNETIRTTARKKLDEFLVKQKLTWSGPNGLTTILLSYWADHTITTTTTSAATPQQGSATDAPTFPHRCTGRTTDGDSRRSRRGQGGLAPLGVGGGKEDGPER